MTRPPNLLLLTTNFPTPQHPQQGVFNLQLARALAEFSRLRVVAPVPWVAAWRAPVAMPAEAPTAFETAYPRFWYTPKCLRRWYGSFLWWSVRAALLPLLRAEPPDAILSYWAHPDGEAAVRAAQIAGVPAIVMVGGSDVLLLANQPVRRRCIMRVLRAAAAVVTVSDSLKQRVVELGIPAQQVHVVPRGVAVERFHPGERATARRLLDLPPELPLLLWVGRMVPVKGLDVLLSACELLRARGTAFQLHLLGTGPLRASLQAQVEARGLSQTIHFAGAVAHDQLPDWYRAADLTVLPSRSEGIPNVLRESLACGTPFVASRVGGIPEITDERSCLLVPPERPDLLAAAIGEQLVRRHENQVCNSQSTTWQESAQALLQIVQQARQACRGIRHSGQRADCPTVLQASAAVEERRTTLVTEPEWK